MLKKATTIICMMLVISFMASFNVFAINESAFDDTRISAEEESLKTNVSQGLTKMLRISEFQDEAIDYDSLSVGNALYSYEYVGGQLVELDYTIYPVFDDNSLFAFAIKYEDTDVMQVTKSLVDEVSKSVTSGEEFAFVYDSDNIYLYTRSGLTLLKETLHITERDSLSVERDFSQRLKLSSFVPVLALDYQEPVSTRSLYYIELDIDHVTQNPYDNLCWIACVACIGNYLTGDDEDTYELMMDYFSGERDEMRTISPATTYLNNYYHLEDYGDYGWEYTVTESRPLPYTLFSNIAANFPVYSAWLPISGTTGHACVVTGIDIYDDYIQIMNPLYDFEIAILISSAYRYTSLGEGITFILEAYSSYI